MASTSVSLATYAALVRGNANFRRLWMAQIVSEIGDWFYALAIYSLLLELTGSAAFVGLAVVLQVLPQTFIGPTAGVVNDRTSRKKVMIVSDLVRAVIVLGMLLVRTRAMVWLVMPLLLFETVMAAFFEPARNAIIPNIVPEDQVLAANAVSSTTWSFNLAIGSALGGFVAVLLGRDAVFVLNAISFLASAALITRMRFEEPHMAGLAPLRARDLVDFSPILEGARYIGADFRLLTTVFVKMGLGLAGANNVILPILGERVFPVRIQGIEAQRSAMLGMSLLMGARGLGALIGPFVSGYWAGTEERRIRQGILHGFLLLCAGYLALGWAPALWIAVICVVAAHAGGSSVWVFSTTLLQTYTEDRFRGRVFAADIGLLVLTIAVTSYVAGIGMDAGLSPQRIATYTGLAVAVPALLWAGVLRISSGPRSPSR